MSKTLDEIRGFCLMDDLFMSECLRDIPCVELVLSVILERPVSVERVRTQEVLRSWGRSVRLDVFGLERTERVKDRYNLEVQREDDGASPRRARFHISIMDTYSLAPGQDFDELGENYVIFITESDVLKRGLPRYTIERYIKETGEPVDDGSHIIYVNGAMRDEDTPLGKLMHDFFCEEPSEMHYSVLSDRTRYFKEDKKGVEEMSSAVERLLSQGRQEGRQEGQQEGQLARARQAASNLLKMGKLTLAEIAESVGLPLAEVQQIGR